MSAEPTWSEADELVAEQQHYDHALRNRREHRTWIERAPQAAACSNAARTQLARATAEVVEALPSDDEPAFFASVTMESGLTRHIGVAAVLSADKKDLLVINWQRPLAVCYYEATPSDRMGMSRSGRSR